MTNEVIARLKVLLQLLLHNSDSEYNSFMQLILAITELEYSGHVIFVLFIIIILQNVPHN